MPQFLVLVHDRADASPLSESDMSGLKAEYRRWVSRLVELNAFTGGGKLCDDGGMSLRLLDGLIASRPGPVLDELAGGYFVLQANDYQSMLDLAKSCPHLAIGGRVEIRQIDD